MRGHLALRQGTESPLTRVGFFNGAVLRVGAGAGLGGVGALVANTSHLSQKEEKQDKKAPNLA